jgi:hypothetical protein
MGKYHFSVCVRALGPDAFGTLLYFLHLADSDAPPPPLILLPSLYWLV